MVAHGVLFETEVSSEALLCPGGGWPPDVGCFGTVVVPVRGVYARDFPGSEADPNVPDLPGGTWVTSWVRVNGVWVDDALRATRVELADRPLFLELIQMPEVPCDPPPGGWPGFGGAPGDIERAWAALETEISRDPDTYSGISAALIPGPDDGSVARIEQASVVGTVVEVDTVAHRLHSIYPYNLCIIRVDHSAAELHQVAEHVREMEPSWEVTDWEYGFGRVIVRVPAFDEKTASSLAPFGSMVTVRPVVTR